MDWFANGARKLKTKRELSVTTIDSFQDTVWDKPFDDLPPTELLTVSNFFFHLQVHTSS